MIPRVLVPEELRPVESAPPTAPRRTTSELDVRIVVPSGMPIKPLDGRTEIPAHVPLDVLVTPVLVPRGFPVKPFADLPSIPAHVPLSVLDSRTVVPAAVEPPTEALRHHLREFPQVSSELFELVPPDVITTGTPNFLGEEKRSRDAVLPTAARTVSAAVHLGIVLLIVFWSSILPARHRAGQMEIEREQFSRVFLPPEVTKVPKVPPRPAPPSAKMKIDPRILKQMEARAAETALPPPGSAPQPAPAPSAPSASAAQPAPLPPSRLENAKPSPTPGKLNLPLPNLSPGRALQQSVQDAMRRPTGPAVNSQDAMPQQRGPGGNEGGGLGYLGNQVQILTPTEGVDFTNYLARMLAGIKRNWYAIIPESAQLGDKGAVVTQFRIMKDGNVPFPEPALVRTSGKEPLDRAAMASIRASSPFEPLPTAFSGPFIEIRIIFLYNLPLDYQ